MFNIIIIAITTLGSCHQADGVLYTMPQSDTILMRAALQMPKATCAQSTIVEKAVESKNDDNQNNPISLRPFAWIRENKEVTKGYRGEA